MDKGKVTTSDISVALSRALDEIGVNEVTVKKRRGAYLYYEKACLISSKLLHIPQTTYVFGSQTEGSTTDGLDSDCDYVVIQTDYNVIKDVSEWTPGKINLLMLMENTAPGYCRLQLLKTDKAEPEIALPDDRFVYASCDRVVMINTAFDDLKGIDKDEYEKNGPALTFSDILGVTDTDLIKTLLFPKSVRRMVTEDWARRNRSEDWPTEALIGRVCNEDILIVPVGYKLGETPNLEWRISTSLAERQLMFSFNIVQMKCYVVLKMLVKTFVTPQLGDCITSYHCKTTMFYCMEDTEADFWRENNLLQCVNRCLSKLHDLVADEFCPHYIMQNANLFAGKVTAANQSELLSVLKTLIQRTGSALQDVCIDELGRFLKMKLNQDLALQDNPALLSNASITTLLRLEISMNMHTAKTFNVIMQCALQVSQIGISVTRFIQLCLQRLHARLQDADVLEKEVMEYYNLFLLRWLQFILASSSFSLNERLTEDATAIIGSLSENKLEFAVKLKSASVLYCAGDLNSAERILQQTKDHFVGKAMIPFCVCSSTRRKYSYDVTPTMYTADGESRFFLVQCVVFTEPEMYCAPSPLRYEVFKSLGIDKRDIADGPNIHDWVNVAVVDCLPFLYFLEYITYRQLNKPTQSRKALNDLSECIFENGKNGKLNHLETAWNLLGQCLEMEWQPDAALQCYRASLLVRRENNAANWLGALLLYKAFV